MTTRPTGTPRVAEDPPTSGTRQRAAWRTAGLLCVVIGTVLLVAAVVVVSALTPDYDWRADTISRLGSAGQPHATWIRAVFVLYGLSVLAGCVPLGEAGGSARRWVSIGVAVYALAAIVTGIAPKDPPDVPASLVSQTHVAATVVGGAALLAVMVVVARQTRLPFERWFSTLVAALAATDVVVFRFSWGTSYYGLLQRGSIALALLWLTVVAARLLVRHPLDDAGGLRRASGPP